MKMEKRERVKNRVLIYILNIYVEQSSPRKTRPSTLKN